MSTYEAWREPGCLSFGPQEALARDRASGFISAGAQKIWTVEADSWEEAMTKYHEHMDWEPYVPMEDPDE